jgi:hypothetical protein
MRVALRDYDRVYALLYIVWHASEDYSNLTSAEAIVREELDEQIVRQWLWFVAPLAASLLSWRFRRKSV